MLGSRCCGRHAVASCCLRRCLCSQAVSNCHQLSLVTNPHCLPQVSLASQQLCNSSAGSAVSSQACTSADVEGFTAGYKSMCQFLSLPLLQLPQVAKYDVIMRLDSDSFIHGALLACASFAVVLILVATASDDVRSDPFQDFASRQCSYGYMGIGSEHPRMLRGLFQVVADFMSRASKQVQPWFRRQFMERETEEVYNGDFFYNNFEMCAFPLCASRCCKRHAPPPPPHASQAASEGLDL